MKRSLFLVFLVLSVLHPAFGAEPNQPATIAVIVIHSEGGTASSAERIELPRGLRLSELFLKERTFKLHHPISWAQGSVELHRLPGPGKPGMSLRLAQIDVRKTKKVDVVLEEGDIVISDMWPDL